MRDTYRAMIAHTTTDTESRFGQSRRPLRAIDLIVLTAKKIFPDKRAANLAAISSTSPRACEAWLSGKANLSADALANILRSEHGLEFLEAIVGDAKPVWYRQFRRRVKAAQLEAKMTKLGKELDAVRRGDQEA